MGIEQSILKLPLPESNPPQNSLAETEPPKKYIEPDGTKIEVEPTEVEPATDVVKKTKKPKQSKQQTTN